VGGKRPWRGKKNSLQRIEACAIGGRAQRAKSARKWGRNGGGESDLGFGVRSPFIAEVVEGACNGPPISTPGFSHHGEINSNGKKDHNPIR
jgi:hypothetical protein